MAGAPVAVPMDFSSPAAKHFVTRSESEERQKKRKITDKVYETKATTDGEMNEQRDEDSADDGPWQDAYSRRRRRSRQTYRKVDAERTKLQRTTVLIRPKDHRSVTAIPKVTLHKLIQATAPDAKVADYATCKTNAQSNTVTVTTYDELHADNLCKVSTIQVTEETTFEVEIFRLYGHNVSRGVITTDPNNTNEELRSVLRCETANVLEARQMGKSGRALLTFDSPVLPKRIKYYSELCKVTPYVARMLICYRCHGEGHMQKYCPNEEICSRCGTGHTEKECERQDKHCVTCKGNGHLATDATCPEKDKRLKENKDRLERRSRSRSRRRTANSKMTQQGSQDLDSYPVLSGTMVSSTPKAVSFANEKDSYASKVSMGLHANIEGEIAALRKTIEEASRRLTQLLSQQVSVQTPHQTQDIELRNPQDDPIQLVRANEQRSSSQPRRFTPNRPASKTTGSKSWHSHDKSSSSQPAAPETDIKNTHDEGIVNERLNSEVPTVQSMSTTVQKHNQVLKDLTQKQALAAEALDSLEKKFEMIMTQLDTLTSQVGNLKTTLERRERRRSYGSLSRSPRRRQDDRSQ